MAAKRRAWLCPALAFAAFGCGHSDAGRSVVGEWAMYSPIANGIGSITFTNSTFTEEIPRQGKELEIKGSYTQRGDTLLLRIDPESVRTGDQADDASQADLELSLTLEWSGGDVVYLKGRSTDGKQQAEGLLAMSRNGAKPDLSRLSVSVSVLGGPDSSFRLADDNPPPSHTTQPAQIPASPPSSAPQGPPQGEQTTGQGDAGSQQADQSAAGQQSPPTTASGQQDSAQNPPGQGSDNEKGSTAGPQSSG